MEENAADAFDGSAEPIIYLSENRTPVMIEFSTTVIYIIFGALLLSLLLILPGMRRTKFLSLLGIFTYLAMGASIMLGLLGSQWLTGELQIQGSPYSSMSSETVSGKLELDIGLSWVNVSLVGELTGYVRDDLDDYSQVIKPVNYNERFHWDLPERIATEHIEALQRGLPYPILSVSEFLSQDIDGFNWSRQIRMAGQYCALVLYLSLASWFVTATVMCAIPQYLPHMMQITGALMMLSVTIFTVLTQGPKNLSFFINDGQIELAFGFTYMLTFVVGALALLVGLLMMVIQMNNPQDPLTIMDSDSYLKNQKALYDIDIQQSHYNIGKPHRYFVDLATFSGLKKSDAVIPIDDIQEKKMVKS